MSARTKIDKCGRYAKGLSCHYGVKCPLLHGEGFYGYCISCHQQSGLTLSCQRCSNCLIFHQCDICSEKFLPAGDIELKRCLSCQGCLNDCVNHKVHPLESKIFQQKGYHDKLYAKVTYQVITSSHDGYCSDHDKDDVHNEEYEEVILYPVKADITAKIDTELTYSPMYYIRPLIKCHCLESKKEYLFKSAVLC